MSFTPNLFLSNIAGKDGLAKPNRFQVILPIPTYVGKFVKASVLEKLMNLPNTLYGSIIESFTSNSADDIQSKTSNPSITRYLSLQCESTELPGKSLQTADVKIYGPSFKVPFQTTYNDINLNFLCTNDFYERKLFDRWIEAIMPPDTNNLRFPKDEDSRYMTNIKIIQYDDFIKQIYAIELIDAFPIGIAGQNLSWSDDNFHRLSVQFAYQKFNTIYDGKYDLETAATAIFGNYAANNLFNPRL